MEFGKPVPDLGHLKGSQVARVSLTSAPRKTCSFALELKKSVRLIQWISKTFARLQCACSLSHANEPHQVQDLCKRVQEKLIDCNMKSHSKDIDQTQKVSQQKKFTGQGYECKTHFESCASWKTSLRYIKMQAPIGPAASWHFTHRHQILVVSVEVMFATEEAMAVSVLFEESCAVSSIQGEVLRSNKH